MPSPITRASARVRIGRVRAVVAPAAITLLSACAMMRGREPAREIAVDLPTARAEAVRRTLAVFRDQGYEVRESLTSGSNPETKPFRHRDDADVVFRAAIAASGSNSRVVFSGTYRKRQLGGLMHSDERAVRDSDDPLEHELWARLSNVALMLRQSSGRPARR